MGTFSDLSRQSNIDIADLNLQAGRPVSQAGERRAATDAIRTSIRACRTRAEMETAFAAAYQAQLSWSQFKVSSRAAIIAKLSAIISEQRHALAAAITSPMRADYRETVSAELLPLCDAAKWLGRKSSRILAPRHLDSGGSPKWLGRLSTVVHRVPYGLVLVLGTWNYPIFLTGVQVLHALAAGNAVAIKPAPGCERVTEMIVRQLHEAGVPEGLVVLLDSSIDTAKTAIDIGVDHIVMTGSSASGRAVLHQAAQSLTPATMELSGCDAVFVLPGADMHRVCDLLRFGLRLNGGATCLAPRRVFVPRKSSEVFHRLLAERLNAPEQSQWRTWVSETTYHRMWDGVADALNRGATIFSGESRFDQPSESKDSSQGLVRSEEKAGLIQTGHLVLTDMSTEMSLCTMDLFAPLMMIVPVDDWSDALRADSRCPYALTASIFGPTEDALRLVKFISAGSITINDLIVPTADPRVPFGGRNESGFGVTRGVEGLLAMTTTKVVTKRIGNWLPHAQLPDPSDERILDGVLQFVHGRGIRKRLRGLKQIVQAILVQRNARK